MKTDNTKGNRWSTRGTIYAEWVREESKYERKKNIKRKKDLQQRENNKKEDKTIWNWDNRAKINRKRKEKKIKGKSVDYAVKTKNSVSQMER